MAANRMQRIFQLRSSEKSFVSRIFPKKIRVCLPLLLLQNGLSETYSARNKGKNAE